MKIVLVVTGASRGLGRAIASSFCQDDRVTKLKAILVARSNDGLQQTKDQMVQIKKGQNERLDVVCQSVDLGDLDSLDRSIDQILASVIENINEFNRMIFVNNAGSLGHIGQCSEAKSLVSTKATVDFNITSALWMSARMLKIFRMHPSLESTIVNISSLVAVQPFPTLAMYSAGKAARDSYHSAMALELKDEPHIKILNYAPGPLETDMTESIRSAEALDASLKPSYQQTLVDPNDSASVLVNLILQDKFVSGSHVDYYDVKGQ